MAKTREIKKRIKAVGNIKRITRTMQMIATAKFSAAQQAAVAGRPYADSIFGLVAELAAAGVDHPLLAASDSSAEQSTGNELTLVLTSDRGLCGPYNGSVLRTAMKHIRDHGLADEGRTELVGKKGVAFLKFNKVPVTTHHTQFGDKPAYEDVERLAQSYIDGFVSGELSKVSVIYMKYISAGKQVPEVMQLLPFPRPEGEADESATLDYEFSPSAPELLGQLVPAAVKATLFQCFSDAVVSEHVARMVAMKAATDNAGKMSKDLTRVFNRARQAQITTELTEIISGAAALE
ncbi:MAG: ATP synthase F1 subunit gamma [Planctomycetota bacterium]